MDIPIPKGDPKMDPEGKGTEKISFHRSKFERNGKMRMQTNEITSWVDGNTVYGSSEETMKGIR